MAFTRAKICGITNVDDALSAEAHGFNALGLNFYDKSPRFVTSEQAATIASAVGPMTTIVGLFVDAEAVYVEELMRSVRLDVLQFHGGEEASFCSQFGKPYMKAVRMRSADDFPKACDAHPEASAILVDAYKPGVPGGTGETFNWDWLSTAHSKRVVLAGGLNKDNVADAIQQVNPYAVDVSGGVEERPGIKDHKLIEQFMSEVKRGSR